MNSLDVGALRCAYPRDRAGVVQASADLRRSHASRLVADGVVEVVDFVPPSYYARNQAPLARVRLTARGDELMRRALAHRSWARRWDP